MTRAREGSWTKGDILDGSASHSALSVWSLWLFLLILATLVMYSVREQVSQAHVVLLYLLLVLGGSISGGRALGFTFAAGGVFLIDYFFQRPFDAITIGKALDGILLISFLATALVATQLLALAKAEAARARAHAMEVERLSIEAGHAEALREANRFKDILIASVSHDLRTPLTTIKALAQDIAVGGEGAVENGAVIAEQAERLSRMVSDVLDLSRLNSESLVMQPELNTAEDLVGATVQQFIGIPDAVRRIHTVIDYSRPALLGTFDFVQTLRILTNLVDNALRYGPADTPVTLTVSSNNGMLAFDVADEGAGVPV
ncbi:MAG TPA: DUF4118 domain-containing protein, partial [Gemmatimonadaceae bacterium]|nr:DUF4118 domain-containing protein [Gemmatimonadaceae bacterium]